MAKVLIVDDEEIARISLAEILRLEGYSIKTVESGYSAVDILGKEAFDVMILDIKMPGMSGIDVLRAVMDSLADLKVIVLTAHGSMDTAIQALRFKVNDYLLKPVNPEEIIDSIEAALASKKKEEPQADIITRTPKLYHLPGDVVLDLHKRTVRWDGGNLSLTPTEARLMGTLCDLDGQMATHSELVLICQGYRVDNEEAAKILRPVVSRLRQKLSAIPNWGEWIKNVRGAGYVLEKPEV